MNEESLVQKLVEYNEAYRVGESIVSDYEYDKLVDQLKELNPNNDWFKRGVNDSAPLKKKYQLTYPMYSLNKCKSLEEIEDWLKSLAGDTYKDIKLIITPKFDGLSVQRNLESGDSWTRGNGEVGQVCTPQLKAIMGCGSSSEISGFVRGEVVFTNDNWEKTQERYPEYKSSRNTATGWINGDYKPGIPYSLLSYMCYEAYNSEWSKIEQLEFLNSKVNSFECPYKVCEFPSLSEDFLDKLFRQWLKVFPIDGLVIDVNNPELRTQQEANGNPCYARAYKHPSFSERKETQILKIERNINRMGVVTPILHIKPIELAGATIKKVNGINMSYIHDWLLYPGETITVVRSGEVIPKVVEVDGVKIPFREEFDSEKKYTSAYENLSKKRHFEFKGEYVGRKYITCPFCHETLSWDETLVNLVCTNKDCEEKRFQGIVDFFKILGVENVKEDTFRTLYNSGLNTIGKLLCVESNDLVKLDGWAETSAKQYRREMDRLLHEGVPCAKLCHASGLFGRLGEKTIQLILDNIYPLSPTLEKLISIKGISEISAKQYIEGTKGLLDEDAKDMLLVKILYTKTPEKEKGIMSGEVIVFSGFRDQSLKERFEKKGASVEDSLTKKTTVLIVKDKGQITSKIQKAMKMGIPIYSQKEIEVEYSNIFE